MEQYLIPIIVAVPVTALLTAAIVIPIPQTLSIVYAGGYLQAITLGEVIVEVRRVSDNALLATVVFNKQGAIEERITNASVSADDALRYNVTSIGTGAAGCYVALWGSTT